MSEKLSIAIAWNGLPEYAARQIQFARGQLGVSFPVIATRLTFPSQHNGNVSLKGVYWVEPGEKHTWGRLNLEIPPVFIQTGWAYQHFNSLAEEVRDAGGKVIGMFDNNWKGNIRQILGGIYFRLMLRKKYFMAWVPGKSGNKLARYLGFKDGEIVTGMYGADPRVFSSRIPMANRKKQIIFVGRLIRRKGIRELISAFNRIASAYPDWRLLIAGQGEDADLDGLSRQIHFLGPVSSGELNEYLNQSRYLILPSREEHWGLVVHEAALCGCALILQKVVGSVPDLASKVNSILIEKTSINAISKAMENAMIKDLDFLDKASHMSVVKAKNFGPEVYYEGIQKVLERTALTKQRCR